MKLDLDRVSYKKVKSISRWLVEKFDLWGFIILRSSKDNYHVVFDRPVSWEENTKTLGYLMYMADNMGVDKWVMMQLIKGFSVLRVSRKLEKSRPRIIYPEGSQFEQIAGFKEFRNKFGKIK